MAQVLELVQPGEDKALGGTPQQPAVPAKGLARTWSQALQ